jgi:hypothetical protein
MVLSFFGQTKSAGPHHMPSRGGSMATPYQPDITAVGDSVFLTAMVSIIPLAVVFIFLGILKS